MVSLPLVSLLYLLAPIAGTENHTSLCSMKDDFLKMYRQKTYVKAIVKTRKMKIISNLFVHLKLESYF